jgi:hypothetical protein
MRVNPWPEAEFLNIPRKTCGLCICSGRNVLFRALHGALRAALIAGMNKNRFRTLDLFPFDSTCPTRQRLAQAFIRLQNIEFTRNQRQNPVFAKSDEERIIWRELLDLELQELDEQIERLSEVEEVE